MWWHMNEEISKIKNEEASKKGTGYYANRPEFGNKGPSKLRQTFSRGMTYFLVIAASILFYFSLLRLTNISEVFGEVYRVLKPIIYGLGLAYLLNPIMKRVEKFIRPFLQEAFPQLKKSGKIARGIGIFVANAVLLAVVVALCNMLIPELYKSIRDMVATVPSQLNDVLDKLNEVNRQDTTIGNIMTSILKEGTDFFQTWLRTDLLKQTNILMSNLTVGVISIVSELLNLIIGIIVSVYVLFSKEVFSGQTKKFVYAVCKPAQANMILHLTKKSNEIFGGFIIGKIIDSAIIGVLCFLGLSLLNMPYTLLVSVIVGVTNVIPFFGPYIGAIPSSILIMLEDPKKGIYFILFIIVLQQLDGNIIGPKILGDSTGLSAFWVVFSILLGGGLFGIPGMILGVPTFAVFYYIVNMLLIQKLKKRKLPTGSASYDEMSYVDSAGAYVHSTQNDHENVKEKDKK